MTWKDVAEVLAQSIRDHGNDSECAWDPNLKNSFSAFLHKRGSEEARCKRCHRLAHKTKDCPETNWSGPEDQSAD